MLRMRQRGMTFQEIANYYGVSRQAINNRIRKGEPRNPSVRGRVYGRGHHRKGRGRARHLVRLRDDFTCQDCRARRTLRQVQRYNSKIKGLKGRIKLFDVHHQDGRCGKLSRGYDTTMDLDGLVTLCHRCHFNRPEHTQRKRKV